MANISNKATARRTALTVLWRKLVRDAFDSYRPELHYMRGPGPKWRAKHGIAERPAATSMIASASLSHI